MLGRSLFCFAGRLEHERIDLLLERVKPLVLAHLHEQIELGLIAVLRYRTTDKR